MPPYSTGGVISSRWFHTGELENALSALPSSQRREVRALARKINKRTKIGYYASLDLVATIGVYISEPRGRKTVALSPKSGSSVV